MKSFGTLAVVASQLLSLAAALPATDASANEAFDTLDIAPLRYSGPVVPGGEHVNLTGTVESIYSQILALNPDFESAVFDGAEDSDAEEDFALATRSEMPPQPPKLQPPSHVQCWVKWRPALPGAVALGIQYLKSFPGKCEVNGLAMSRISCSRDSGIYWANRNEDSLVWPCKELALEATQVYKWCASTISVNGKFENRKYKWDVYIMGVDKTKGHAKFC